MRGAYVHQFGVRTGGSLYYGLSIRKSIDFPIQYEIHDAGASFDHSFSPSTSLSLGLGYYKPTGDTSLPGTPGLDPGVTSLIEFTKGFRRGSFSLGARSGWDDGLMEVIPRGFTKFGGAFARVEYTPVENVNVFANGTYRKNRYANEQFDILQNQATEDETYRGRCGVNWRFYRWFSLGLFYNYTNRISPDPNNEFVDNRIGLTLTAQKPFKW
ncbi:MAG: outer membrane beta-barrel protein [Deltaproteobacteria bacterium]|nr:outer membrane beta-barrel protein [Deltaproteobacteria bacterium]